MFKMLVTLIGIQTIAVVTATSYVINYFRPKNPKMKVYNKSNGFKHYKSMQEVAKMGTIIMGALGVCAFLGSGMALSAAFHYFHEFKPSKKKVGGDSDDAIESLRKKSGLQG